MTKIEEYCQRMVSLGASDLFLCEGKSPSFRKNGELEEHKDLPAITSEDSREFIEAFLPSGTWERLARERDLDVAASIGSDGDRYRVNLSYQQGRRAFAIRLIPSGNLDGDKLGIPSEIVQMASPKSGLVLVTGATGSGKSTTLACMLHYLNTHYHRHIVTLEDPVEFVHKDICSVISQREIGSDTQDFAVALRQVVRQNPDVIFIGELRDEMTVTTAISAALTGHMVAATMHTMNVTQTLERLIAFYPEEVRQQASMDLGMVLTGIVSQKLLPKADGTGRVPAFEVLTCSPVIKRLLVKQEFTAIAEIVKASTQRPMVSMNRYLLELYKKGIITLENGMSASSNPDEFALIVQGMETGVDSFRIYSADPDHGMSMKKLLRDAVRYHASDLLLTAGSPPVIRIDGLLTPFEMPTLTPSDTRKLLFSILSAREKADFEENRELDVALSIRGLLDDDTREYRFRVNGFYQKGAVAAALRMISQKIPTPEELMLPEAVVKLAQLPQGLVLVTGPTGSGKSTTLACLIDLINQSRPCHIITVEDPIEFVHNHKTSLIEQREVHADTLSFPNALKYVLRQDPDVVLVGEMRDPETIGTVLTAAETGHLVFATLHTNDVTQTVDRIIDVFPSDRQNQVRMQLAATLEAVIAQRLVPRNTSAGGRIAAFEVLLGTTAVKAMIRDKKTHQLKGMMETCYSMGMITMERAFENLLSKGLISQKTFNTMVHDYSKDTMDFPLPLK